MPVYTAAILSAVWYCEKTSGTPVYFLKRMSISFGIIERIPIKCNFYNIFCIHWLTYFKQI